jgi:hypothetical protein
MLDDFPNHKKNTAVANSYRYSTCGRSIFNKRNDKTISVKDLFNRELLSTKSQKDGGSVLPKINLSDIKNKGKRPSTISSVFTLSSVGKKQAFMFEPIQAKPLSKRYVDKNEMIQKQPIERVSKLLDQNKRLQHSNTKLRPRSDKFMNGHLKDISDEQSACTREVSLEKVDETNLGVPKGYLKIRKSFKNKDQIIEIGRCKSTFKQRVNRKKDSSKSLKKYRFK